MAKNNPHNIQIGQILYDYNMKEYTVESIGNKYLTISKMRNKVELDTLQIVTQYQSKKLYADKEQLIRTKRQSSLLRNLKNGIMYCNETKYSLEQLEQVSEILGLPEPHTQH